MKITKTSIGRKGQKGRSPKYDISIKRKVAQEYLGGNQSVTQIGEMYNIPHNYVSRWVKEFSSELAGDINISPMTEQEQTEMTDLQKQIKSLKEQLEYEQMRSFAFETMVDLAKSELGIDLRKNSGAKQPEE
jgi:transposase-like protein